ncbi:hypothetical protein OTU49_002787, partial [Cherax quadricarinatus]
VVQAAFTCAAVLISVGATLGTTSPTQLLLMALLEVPIYQINAYIGYRILAVVDHGGSIFIHTFGAYFGLGFSRSVLRRVPVKDHPREVSGYIPDMFSMIGTLFLWVYWPSFNGVVESGRSQGRAVINTYLSLSASTLAAFMFSASTHKQATQVDNGTHSECHPGWRCSCGCCGWPHDPALGSPPLGVLCRCPLHPGLYPPPGVATGKVWSP